jgi:hypothetical protein
MADQIPPPGPAIDSQGQFLPVWYRWFYTLFARASVLPPGTFGTAALKNVTDNTLATVASVETPVSTNHAAVFADAAGTIKDGGVLGTAARKAASDPTAGDVASVIGPVTSGNLVVFGDSAGSVTDGGAHGTAGTKAASDVTKPTVASVAGAFTVGHFAVAADIAGSIKDGGSQGTMSTQDASGVLITGGSVVVPILGVTSNNGFSATGQTSDAGAAAGTLGNSPTAGNPAFWLRIVINGSNFAIPAWTA